jgi:hypothetical protein
MTPISNHFGAFYCTGTKAAACGPPGWFGGADFSVPAGIIIAGLVYFVLERATGNVARQVTRQKELEPNL